MWSWRQVLFSTYVFFMGTHSLYTQPAAPIDFDWQQLKQLAGEDAAFEIELLEMFLSDAMSSLERLEQAIACHNIQTIEDIAHSLRGASANVGATGLTRVARQLEHTARSGQLAEAQSLVRQIRQHCLAVRAYIHSKQSSRLQ